MFTEILLYLPLLTILCAGIFVSFRTRHRFPRAWRFTVSALAVFLVLRIIYNPVKIWLWNYADELGLEIGQTLDLLNAAEFSFSALAAFAWVLVLFVIFGERR